MKGIDIKKWYHKYRNDLKCYLLLLVPICLFSVFFVYGFVRGFVFSLLNYDLRFVMLEGLQFVGFEHYAEVFRDKDFLNGLLHTTIWTVVMLIGNNGFGLLMAVCLMKLSRGRKFFLAGLYWPALVSAAITTQITLYVFNPTETGILNSFLSVFGIPPKDWLVNEDTALISLMVIPFFTGFSQKMIIFYAGLNGIPKTYYEAASLDTDSGVQIFGYITWPLLGPVVFLNVLISLIEGMKVIAPMQLITPHNDFTMSAIYAMYIDAFENTNFSFAFAEGFVMFVIIMVLTVIQNLTQKETVVYE